MNDSVLAKVKDLRELPIVRIFWLDSTMNRGWGDLPEHRGYKAVECQTAGFLIKNTRAFIHVGLNISSRGGVGDTMIIPRSVVSKFETLRRGRKYKK